MQSGHQTFEIHPNLQGLSNLDRYLDLKYLHFKRLKVCRMNRHSSCEVILIDIKLAASATK